MTDNKEIANSTKDSIENQKNSDSAQHSLKKKSGNLKGWIWRVLKVPLYLVFLILAVVLIAQGLESLTKYALKKSYLGSVYPNRDYMIRSDFTRPVAHYDYDFVPGVCLEYNIVKGNSFEYANNAGFREPRPIEMEKPADEFRIFLTGGSTAYGLGSVGEAAPHMNFYGIEYRETISHLMEKILNASAPIPGKTVRVYNAAVWGYSYQHLLMRYIVKLRNYNPDLIISLDGANEIPLLSKISNDWDYFSQGQFQDVLREIYAYTGPGLTSYLTLWLKNNTFVMTYLWQGKDMFQELTKEVQSKSDLAMVQTANTENYALEEKSRIVNRNISQIVRVVEDYHSAMQNDGVNHIIALQPWYYLSKKPKHEKEKILDTFDFHKRYFDIPSDKMYTLFIEKMRQSAEKNNYFLVDFSEYFDDVSEWVFTDWCHLTAGANFLLAKELSNLVKEHLLSQPLTAADTVQNKEGYFWDIAASSAVKHAPESKGAGNVVENMLKGYPSEKMYVSRNAAPEEELSVELDLGREFDITRLRLVWADSDSIPRSWKVQYSMDGTDWKDFVDNTSCVIDHYSRWPGTEYYASQPAAARYFRYKPLDENKTNIKLRLWALYR